MILFKKLRYKNFLSTGNIFTEIDLLNNKSNLIVGENGSGKSTLLDALSYVLFNKSFRGVNKPELVNSITNKNMLVEVEFNDYLVRRGMKPNIFEIYYKDKLINQEAANKDYQEILENNILKLKHKSFNQIVVIGSANFVPFMQLPASSRREVIEDLLDLQIFSIMNSLLKERVQQNKNLIVDIEHEMNIIDSKISMQKKHIKTLEKNNNDIKTDFLNKIQKLTEENSKIEENIKENEILLNEKLNLIKDQSKVKTNLTNISNIKDQIQNKKGKLLEVIDFYNNNNICPTCNQELTEDHKHKAKMDGDNSIKELDSAIVELETKYDTLNKKYEEIIEISIEATKLSNNKMNLNHEFKSNEKLIKSIQNELNNFKEKTGVIENEYDELEKLKNNVILKKTELEEIISNKEILNVAATLLKDGGIKSRIIKQYIPIINNLINKYLSAMDTFIQFELDENFNEKITSRNREESTYYSFSQGERMRIDLALLFTWRAISKIRNSNTTNLLIMDEILDSSLDSSGLEEFLKIINELTKDSNVFIISHKEQMLDKFDRVVKFEKIKNFSRMVA